MRWAFLTGLAALIYLVGSRLFLRWVPPHRRYLSRRKRRAMALALRAFTEDYADDYPQLRASWPGSWVYSADSEKCVVFVQQSGWGHPAIYSGYVVPHDRDRADRLGGRQFSWGILPRHAIERYERLHATPQNSLPDRTENHADGAKRGGKE